MSDKPSKFVNLKGSGTIKLGAGSGTIKLGAGISGKLTVFRVEPDILRRVYEDTDSGLSNRDRFYLAAEQWVIDQRNGDESEPWVIDAVTDHLSKLVNRPDKYRVVVDLLYRLAAVGRMRAWRNRNGGRWDWDKMATDLNVIKIRTGKPVPGKTLQVWWRKYRRYLWVIDAVTDHLSKLVNKPNKYPVVVDLLYKLAAVGRMRAWRDRNPGNLSTWDKMATDLNVIKIGTGKRVPPKTLQVWWRKYRRYLDDPPTE